MSDFAARYMATTRPNLMGDRPCKRSIKLHVPWRWLVDVWASNSIGGLHIAAAMDVFRWMFITGHDADWSWTGMAAPAPIWPELASMTGTLEIRRLSRAGAPLLLVRYVQRDAIDGDHRAATLATVSQEKLLAGGDAALVDAIRRAMDMAAKLRPPGEK